MHYVTILSFYSHFISIMKTFIFSFFIFALVSCSKDANKETNQVDYKNHEPQSFVKAAHYFANSWAKTFWEEFEERQVDKDMKQIKSDGFNTVILVVPWVGFEENFQNKATTSSPEMYRRLGFMLNAIKHNKLNYMLRLGYPHSFTPNAGTTLIDVCTNIYERPQQKEKWIQYLNNIKRTVEEYSSNSVGTLVSWEDFWCPHFVFPGLSELRRKELAKNMGYAQWVMKKDLTLLKVLYGKNNLTIEDIAVPKKDEMSYFYYIEFIDDRFREIILNSTKSIFPDTAMEIRIDKDPVKSSSGEYIWVEHDLYFDEENHKGTYWAPFWGAENKGEKLDVNTALFNFEYFLNYITNNGQATNHIIEQFNFKDNTPGFSHNAILIENQVDEFLLKSTALLKKYSQGYGIWTYHDYADNGLYNSSFELGLKGWKHSNVGIIGDQRDQQIQMQPKGWISQTYNAFNRFLSPNSYKTLQLCINTSKEGEVGVYSNELLVAKINLSLGEKCYPIAAENLTQVENTFKIVAISAVIIDELKLYGFVQKLGLYDEHGKELEHIESIRLMNKAL